MSTSALSFTVTFLEKSITRYLQDAQALSEEKFLAHNGGVSRSAADVTVEVTAINTHIAALLRGESPAPLPFEDGWMKAPAEGTTQEGILTAFSESAASVKSAIESLDETTAEEKASGQFASMTKLEVAHLVAMHITYHGAQLNYIQALNGDNEMHWM